MSSKNKCCHSSHSSKQSVHSKIQGYTCPMHPEVYSLSPGDCPECGMALEPIGIQEAENHELRDFSRRFWGGLFFIIPLVILEMGSHIMDLSFLISKQVSIWLQFCLSLPIVFWSGKPLFQKAYRSFYNLKLNMFSLIGLGSGAAFVFSLLALFQPNIFPKSIVDQYGIVPVYFEAASVIIILVLLGQVLELNARQKTESALRALIELAPKSARIVTNDGYKDISIDSIQEGDMLIIRPGEKIPVDGVVAEGSAYIDESMLTGESRLVSKHVGSPVYSATMNESGSLVVKANKVGEGTILASIIEQVAQAQRSRAPIQRIADQISSYFVPAVIIIAFITFLFWLMLASAQPLSYALITAISVLIIACPCALGLATPMSIKIGVGQAALSGILFKDAQSLEVLEKVDVVFFDKTGTLTKGKPEICNIQVYDSKYSKDQILQIAASVEVHSEHPIAKALLNKVAELDFSLETVKNVNSYPSKGIKAQWNTKRVLVGNLKLLNEFGVSISSIDQERSLVGGKNTSSIYVVMDNNVVASIYIHDPIRSSAKSLIQKLQSIGIETQMLTGDQTLVAKEVASKLKINRYHANLLPHEKAKIISDHKTKGLVVAMVGDGINDAVALSSADIGIAMGSGTDVAVHSSGITLLGGDLNGLYKAIDQSKTVMRNIKQNLALAFGYNIICIPIAAGLCYPFMGILLNPMFAGAAMSLSSLSVIGNALRLKYSIQVK